MNFYFFAQGVVFYTYIIFTKIFFFFFFNRSQHFPISRSIKHVLLCTRRRFINATYSEKKLQKVSIIIKLNLGWVFNTFPEKQK